MFDEQAGLPVDYRQQANALIEKVFGKEQSIGPYKRVYREFAAANPNLCKEIGKREEKTRTSNGRDAIQGFFAALRMTMLLCCSKCG